MDTMGMSVDAYRVTTNTKECVRSKNKRKEKKYLEPIEKFQTRWW